MTKDKSTADLVVCYCAGITLSEIGGAVAAGATTILQVRDFTSKHASGDCAVKNPTGKCCTPVFKQEIENFRNKNQFTFNPMNDNQLKDLVRAKYTDIALQGKENEGCCCGGTPKKEVYKIMSDDYSKLDGYNEDADLGLGCGLPTQYAGIKRGDTVIDLGSGAGNDCFVALEETGPEGKVIGIDFSDAMLDKAKANAERRGVKNVSFRKGDIEDMPVSAERADVVISNCVLNLLPSKDRIFHEIYRVLKPGGHFCISDVVLNGTIPAQLKEAAEMYVGCVSGAIPKADYLEKIDEAGFADITIQKEKPIIIPDEILEKYLNADELAAFKANGGNAIVSVTITGTKVAGKCSCGGCC